MATASRTVRLLTLIYVSLCVLGMSASAKAELLFYASFDDAAGASHAQGSAQSRLSAAEAEALLTPGDGRWGGALAPAEGAPLQFDVADNIDLQRGTIEFFVRFDDFGGEWREHRLFSVGPHPFDEVFSLSVHPQGEHLIATWRFNDNSGWFHVGNHLQVGQWHHVAVTWEPSDEDAGAVALAVFVDGHRRDRSSKATAYRTSPEVFTLGSDPTGRRAVDGRLDDFAIFRTVRYRDSFTPPSAPVGERVSMPSKSAQQRNTNLNTDKADDMSSNTTATTVTVPNLTNASFTEWADGKPVGWEVGYGAYEPDVDMNIRDGVGLRMTPDREQPAPWLHTQVSQRVSLDPERAYRLRLWMAKDGASRVFIRVRPVISDRADANQAVLDWSNGWTNFFAWHRIELDFTTSSHEAYEVSIVQYGTADQPAWIDDVQIVLEEDLQKPVSTADRERGFELYTDSIMRPFDERRRPGSDRLLDQLHLTAARGEYVPGFFAIRALEDLHEMDARIDGDLKGPDGRVISADDVVIRAVQGEVLPLTTPRSVERERNMAWWVTIRVDEQTEPGTYHGNLAITQAGDVSATLPVALKVDPFILPSANIPMGVYHNERYFPEGYLSAEQRMAYYRDMREHGMNTVTVYNNPHVDGDTLDFDRNQVYAPGVMPFEEMNQRGYMLTEQEIAERHEWGLNQVMDMIEEAGFGDTGMPVMWLANKPGQYNWGGLPKEAMRTALESWQSRSGWPEPLLYVNDEPEGHPDRIADARRTLDRVAELNLDVRTVTAHVAIEELGADYDVWVQMERDIRPEIMEAARDHGAEFWVYNCNVHSDNAPFTRSLFGFWAYRAGVKGVMLWAYYDGLNWRMDEHGEVHGSDGQFGFSRIIPSPDGPVPTPSWESTREGVDDYRYALLFDALAERAAAEAERLKSEARAVLGEQVLEILDERERLLARKKEEGETLPAWEPDTSTEEQAMKHYLAARQLEREAGVAERVRRQVITSIPFDAMALHASLPFMAANREHHPRISLGDPATAAEDKRQVLRSYIRRLNAALAHADGVN